MVRKLLWCALLIPLLFSCKQEDITPSWLKINEFTVTTNEELEGSNSHNITDVWIFMDGQQLGVWELPCKLPVLDEGEHKFTLFPGIKNNGTSSTRKRYPFYNTFEINETLVKNDTVELFPSTTYKSELEFAFIEDFEDAGISFTKGPTSDTDMVFIEESIFPDIVQYGSKCGGVFLNTEDSLYTGITSTSISFPKAQQVYMEVDFKNTNSFAVGVVANFIDGTSNQRLPFVILPGQPPGQEEWKKVYIDLSVELGLDGSAVSHNIYLISALDEGIASGDVFIDNIKLLYFQ